MNDVKISTVELASAQNSASSSKPGTVSGDGGVGDQRTDQALKQGQVKLDEAKSEQRLAESQDRLEDAVTELNEYVQNVQRDLQFKLDNDSGKTIITVVDSRTSEVVRQIPDDVALRLAQDLQQDEPLSLFNAKV